MNTKEQIERLIREHRELRARPMLSSDTYIPVLAKYLAEHLTAVLPVTVDALVEVLLEHNTQHAMPEGGVWICDNGNGHFTNRGNTLFRWEAKGHPGKAAIAAIKSAMPPEPTALERFDRLTKAMDKRVAYQMDKRVAYQYGYSQEELDDYKAIRKALLEAK